MLEFDPERAAARELMCRLLAVCYYEASPAFAEERIFDAMYDAGCRLHPELAGGAKILRRAFDAVSVDELLLDYTRLFLGPNQILAKPYGSVWLSGEKALMQDSTVAVLELYREGGFDLADEFRELPDHIAAELEFLYLMTFRENRARQDDDRPTLATVLDLRKRFLAGHLGAWIAPFASAMEHGAATDFYRRLAAQTKDFVAMEIARKL